MNGLTRKIRADEKGVSPVIGVILMVAITVILAAVIASFVFGFGSKLGTAAPNAQFVLRDDPDNIDNNRKDYVFDIEHAGGDQIPCSDMRVYIYNASDLVDILDWDGSKFNGNKNKLESNSDIGLDDKVFNAGDVIKIHEKSKGSVSPGTYMVKVFYKPSQTLIFSADVTVV